MKNLKIDKLTVIKFAGYALAGVSFLIAQHVGAKEMRAEIEEEVAQYFEDGAQ